MIRWDEWRLNAIFNVYYLFFNGYNELSSKAFLFYILIYFWVEVFYCGLRPWEMSRSSLQVGAYFMVGLNVSNIADLFTSILEWEWDLLRSGVLFIFIYFCLVNRKLN